MNTARAGRARFDRPTGSGSVAAGAAGVLGLAAAPVFAAMALWAGLSEAGPDMLCAAVPGASPMNGMAVMYALMGVFHLAPWLRLIAGR